jgi:hypothetical protein
MLLSASASIQPLAALRQLLPPSTAHADEGEDDVDETMPTAATARRASRTTAAEATKRRLAAVFPSMMMTMKGI